MNLLSRAAHRLATWTKGPWEGGRREIRTSADCIWLEAHSGRACCTRVQGHYSKSIKDSSDSDLNYFKTSQMGKCKSYKQKIPFFISPAATLMRREDGRLLNSAPTGNVINCQAVCHVWSVQPRRRGWREKKEQETLYLLSQRHPAAQSAGQTDDFGHKRLKGQVLLQDHPPEYRLYLRNTWTWEMRKGRDAMVVWRRGEKGRIEGRQLQRRRDEGKSKGGGWGEELIDIHIVFCMHISSELYYRKDFLQTWPLRQSPFRTLCSFTEPITLFKQKYCQELETRIHVFMHE